jgi:hypothetical protein
MVATSLPTTGERTNALPTKDRVIVGLLVFFILIAVTLELYWLIFHDSMLQRTDIFAKLLSIYWPCDRTYRDPGMDNAIAFTMGVESLNVLMKPLDVLLIWAIVKRKPWRHSLQLPLAMCLAYGTILYYYVAHLSGYLVFTVHAPYVYWMFYGINAPWLIGYGYLVYDSCRAIRFANQ